MSLTSFLKIPDVREKFKQQFVKPKLALQKEILSPPRTQRYTMVGTAFDYLLRFYIKYHNPEAIETRWIAEHLTLPFVSRPIWIEETEETTSIPEAEVIAQVEQFVEIRTKAKQIVERAKSVYADYLATGDMTDEVITNTILLAQLDPILRAGYVDDNLGVVDREDVADLRGLISLVKPEIFKAKELCLLNPTFGEASRMVGGADADLIIDNMIVDIKTTKGIQFTLDHFLQLIGYYVLFRIGGVANAPRQHTIEHLGVYYSRYAELCAIPVADVVNEATLEPFINWFKERTEKH